MSRFLDLDFFSRACPTFQCVQESVAKAAIQRLQAVVPRLEAPEALEVGTGHGATLAEFLRVVPRCAVTTVDHDLSALLQAKRTIDTTSSKQRLTFVAGSIPSVLATYADESFDIIFSAFTIHNLPWREKRQMAMQLTRLLRRGGCFVNGDKIQWAPPGRYVADLSAQLSAFVSLGIRIGRPTQGLLWVLHYLRDEFPDRKMNSTRTRKLFWDVGLTVVELAYRHRTECVIVSTKPTA